MPIPDYFGDRLQGNVNIQAPPLAVPVQQTQGIPVDQAQVDYSVDQPSMSARSFMQQDPHAQMRENLLNQLPQVQAARQAAVDKMMAPVQSEDEKLYNKFVNDPKIQRLFTGVAWNGNQRRATMLSFLKQIGDRIENGHKETLDAAKEFGDLTGQTITLRGQMVGQDKAAEVADRAAERLKVAQDRLELARTAEDRHKADSESLRAYRTIMGKALEGKTPAQIAELQALAKQHGLESDILSQYGKDTAAAKLNFVKTNTAAIPYRANTGRMAATGAQLPGMGMPFSPDMVPPPPPDVASGTPILPGGAAAGSINQPVQTPQVQLTPKAAQAAAASQAAADLKTAQTKGQENKNEETNMKLQRKATMAADAIFNASPEKKSVDYWRTPVGKAEYKRIFEQTPHVAQEIVNRLKAGIK